MKREIIIDGKRAYIIPEYEFHLGGVQIVDEKYVYGISRWYSSEDVHE